MKTTDITTKDSEIEVVYGDLFYGDDLREEAFRSLKYLYSDLTDIRKFYIHLGFHLKEFKFCKYYEDFGFLTFEDFCEANIGMDKGAVSRCINVYEEFNASNDVTSRAGIMSTGCAMDLSEKWKDYSYTQLCEILPLSEEDRKNITPDMTVRQIRDYKKQLKQKDAADGSVASTQPEGKESRKLFDIERYNNARGIVRQNIVRNCDPIDDNSIFHVFDKNGKFLYGNVWCDLIYKSGHEYFFRLRRAENEEETETE